MRESTPNTIPAIAPALKEVSLLLVDCEGSEGTSPAVVLVNAELAESVETVLSTEAKDSDCTLDVSSSVMLGCGEEVCSGEVSLALGEMDVIGKSETEVGDVGELGAVKGASVNKELNTCELDFTASN
jgi:hypothetical protein